MRHCPGPVGTQGIFDLGEGANKCTKKPNALMIHKSKKTTTN